MANSLYFGDCLDVMREHIPAESVDLIYLDPPFKSDRNYNLLFPTSGNRALAPMKRASALAFEDTWYWDDAASARVDRISRARAHPAHQAIFGLRDILGETGSLAYVSYMGERLAECRRVLKSTGSVYLHCDPTMSHYLKVLMDGIFGHDYFRNEIIWCYNKWSVAATQFVKNHDVILFYTKGRSSTFNVQYVPVSKGTQKRWKGKKQQAVFVDGVRTATSTVDEARSPCPDWWPLSIVNPNARERLGYPTPETACLARSDN